MYTLLRRGDRLPSVGVLQVLLNRGIAGTKLAKDGDYGSNTKDAVKDFQRPRGLGQDGIVGKNTWPRVSAGAHLQILDAVDITDPDVLNTEGRDLRNAGGNPTLVGYMCNGIEQLVQDLVTRMSGMNEVFLLRFYGHGSPGVMGVSDGVGSVRIGGRKVYLNDEDLSALTPGSVQLSSDVLSRLSPYFGRYSSVELHGCRVAKSSDGRRMIKQLANTWNVPVTASFNYQYAGGTSTFRFEGRTFTACPGGISLKDWASNLPDMVEMSVR